MTQQRKTEITRYAVVTPNEGTKNQYGDLEFTDTEGNKHKIGNKRSSLFEAIIPGRAVKLGYAVYMNKEYIATAELFDGQPAKSPIPQAKTTPVKVDSEPTMTPDKWTEKDRITRKSIERQTSLNAAVELAKVDKIKPEQLLPVAAKFESYLENGYKEVQRANSLIEEAKKMGAKVIGKEDSTTK